MRVVLYSGGALSWAAAMRTIERHGRDDVQLLFTDTSMEDEDLYRFLDDTERQLDIPLVRLKDGRTPWGVYRDRRMVGNSRMDPCSEALKRKMSARWLAEHAARATLVFGIDWTEQHRLVGLRKRYEALDFAVEAPMCEPPFLLKNDVLAWMRREGVEPPRLYAMGFAHNNCGGFCCRAGIGHFRMLLRAMPARYAAHEAEEQAMREFLGKDVSVLRDRTVDDVRPLTLRALRERIQAGDQTLSLFDDEIGGCGCFVDDEAREAAHGI